MARTSQEPPDSYAQARREAAGLLAVGMTQQLATPLGNIHQLLGNAVKVLDHHVANAKGPDPLGYNESKDIRETIAEAFLLSATAARLATDLAQALHSPQQTIESVEINPLINQALALVRHRFATATELFIDLATTPSVSINPSSFVLCLARILLASADSTRQAGETAVSLRSRIEQRKRPTLLITIADNGRGMKKEQLAIVIQLADWVAREVSGNVVAASEPGSGATFEIRIPI